MPARAAQFLAEADEPVGGLGFFTEPRLDGIADGSVVQPIVLRAKALQRSLGPWRGERPVRALLERMRGSGAQLARV